MSRYISTLAVLANSDRYKDIPVIYHTDHIKGPETMEILEAAIRGINYQYNGNQIAQRASTISLDASEFTEEQNVDHMLNLCGIAKESGVEVTLEMESAVDDRITSAEETKQLLGSVEEKFPDHIHLWAPGVGTKHGFGHDMDFDPKNIASQRKLTKEITGREIGIALHGSTGMSTQDLTGAAKAGVVKVNWSTESLLIRSEAAREYYSQEDKFEKQHPDWKNTVMDNGINTYISTIYLPKVQERIKVLNGEGKASGIQLE
jgi:fructose/tagatose bisphosphate aldolase